MRGLNHRRFPSSESGRMATTRAGRWTRRVVDNAAGRNPQGLLHPRERRRSEGLDAPRARTARAGRSTTPSSIRPPDDLRRRCERVARLGRLAEPRPGRDMVAFERGDLVRRRCAEAVEDLGARRRAGPRAGRRRGAGDLRKSRRGRDLVSPVDARRRARQRGLGRPVEPAAGTPWAVGADVRHRGAVALLGDRAGNRALRDDRRRRLVDAAQQRAPRRLAARARGRGVLRPQAGAVAAPTRTGCTSRTTAGCIAATTAANRGRRSRTACRPTSGSRRRRTRTTATRSTSSRSTRATAAACPTDVRRSGARATRERAGSGSSAACRSTTRISACFAKEWRSTRTTSPGLYFGTSTGQVFASADEGESWSEIAELPAGHLLRRGGRAR